MNYYFTFNNFDQGKKLVSRLSHRGLSASLRPIAGTTNRWSVFGKADRAADQIEAMANGIKYIGFTTEETPDA